MSNPAYPTLPISVESRKVLRDGRTEDQSGDGVTRVRKLHADKYDFTITHPNLNAANLATLQTFYGSYGTATAIDLTWPEDGAVYVVRFGKDAINTSSKFGQNFDVKVRLVGV